MGGFVRKIVKRGIAKKVIKPVAKPVLKTPEQGKKTSEALDKKLTENADKGNQEATALLNKRKGRRATIKTTSSGLNDEEIKKKTLLG